MLFVFCCAARLANTLHFDIELLNPEAGRQPALQFDRFDQIDVEVRERMATRANQMVMGYGVGIYAPSSVVETHVA